MPSFKPRINDQARMQIIDPALPDTVTLPRFSVNIYKFATQ
jgi:hypothetical protein